MTQTVRRKVMQGLGGILLAGVVFLLLQWAGGVWFDAALSSGAYAYLLPSVLAAAVGAVACVVACRLPPVTVFMAALLVAAPLMSVIVGMADRFPGAAASSVLRASAWPASYVVVGVLLAGPLCAGGQGARRKDEAEPRGSVPSG